jgi:hypothetical protein
VHVQKQPVSWDEDDQLAIRSTREVIEDHIRLQIAGQLDDDLRRNYAESAVLLTERGCAWNRDLLRQHVSLLYPLALGGSYEVNALQVHGDTGMLVWKARFPAFSVDRGVDSFVVTDGKIRMQTSYYTPSH